MPQLSKVSVSIPLDAFVGQTGSLVWHFDSDDEIGNFGAGWGVRNVAVRGATTVSGQPVIILSRTNSGVTWKLADFDVVEGPNTTTANATRSAYAPSATGQDTIVFSRDNTAPLVSFDAVTTPTDTALQTITGTFVEANPLRLKVFRSDDQTFQDPDEVVLNRKTFSDNTFSVSVVMNEGNNFLKVTLTDQGGNTPIGTDTATVVLDTGDPVITDEGTIYPDGAVSATAEDEVIYQVKASDAGAGVAKVEELDSNGNVVGQLFATSDKTKVPQIISDKFDITGDFVLFKQIAAGTAPGETAVTLRATDLAGNSAEVTVNAKVTATKEAQNIFLSAGSNLAGINLQSTQSPTFKIEDVLAQKLDTSFLDSTFANNLTTALGSSPVTSTAANILSADRKTVGLNDVTGFQPGDRVALSSGDTELSADVSAGATSIIVTDGVTGFVVGRTMVISGATGPFGLGFAAEAESSTIAAINAATNTITTTAALTKAHFQGARVTGIEVGRVVSVDAANNTLTFDKPLDPIIVVGGMPVAEEPKLGDIVDAIHYFTGGLSAFGTGESEATDPDKGEFISFVRDSSGNLLGNDAVDLRVLGQGKSYWFITKKAAFDRSDPLPGSTEGPIIPQRMQLDGVVFDATAAVPSLPSTVVLEIGWNQIALIGETDRVVERGVRGVLFPTRQFTSLLEFKSDISFDSATGAVSVVAGVLNPLFAGDIANPGDVMETTRGFYIFMNSAGGEHTP